ncbi:MAG TPA: FtsQ-type POTRA domain-containing protein [Candidatus Baltobacteraceae bacterium]
MKRASKPSRRKKSRASGLRRWWILAAFVAVLVGIGAYFAATWPALDPKHVAVAGNRVVPTAQILRAAAIAPGTNLWLQNAGAIAQRVEAIPAIDRAWLHRRPPADATIVVTERVPFAVVRTAGGTLEIDRHLRVLTVDDPVAGVPEIAASVAGAPVAGTFLHDPSLAALRDDLVTVQSAHVDVTTLALDKFGGLIATRRGGMKILLGDDDDLAKKLALIGPIERQVGHARRLRAIDLRMPSTPIAVYR